MVSILSTLNRLRKSEEGVNPIFLGWAMLGGVAVPVSLAMLIVAALSILLIVCGLNPTPMILEFIRDVFTALSPILAILFGGWLLYTYLYIVVVVVVLGAFCGPRTLQLSWMRASETLRRLYESLLKIWQSIRLLVSGFAAAFLHTGPLRLSLRNSPPSHLAMGWQPSTHPQME